MCVGSVCVRESVFACVHVSVCIMTDVCVTGRLKCLTDMVWFGKRPHVPMITTQSPHRALFYSSSCSPGWRRSPWWPPCSRARSWPPLWRRNRRGWRRRSVVYCKPRRPCRVSIIATPSRSPPPPPLAPPTANPRPSPPFSLSPNPPPLIVYLFLHQHLFLLFLQLLSILLFYRHLYLYPPLSPQEPYPSQTAKKSPSRSAPYWAPVLPPACPLRPSEFQLGAPASWAPGPPPAGPLRPSVFQLGAPASSAPSLPPACPLRPNVFQLGAPASAAAVLHSVS